MVELRTDQPIEVRFEEDLSVYFTEREPEVLGVDIPIGLPAKGERRRSDVEAKAILGSRASTVFYAPPREVLEQATYADARGVESVSAQAYALRSKIFEVEALAREGGDRVIEVHPELSFMVLQGRVLPEKQSWNGVHERIAVLKEQGIELRDSFLGTAGRIPPDDLLDAAVVAFTARQAATGRGRVLPQQSSFEKLSQRELIWMPGPVPGAAT